MKILVTGSSSFIGFNLVNHLSKKYEVFWSTTKKLKHYKGIRRLRLEKLKKKNNLIIDFNRITNLEKLFKKYKFDYIFIHHAYTKETRGTQARSCRYIIQYSQGDRFFDSKIFESFS